MFCPQCGAENPEAARVCAACGSKLSLPEAEPAATASPPHGTPVPNVIAGLLSSATMPWVAVLLSAVIPGLGQLYNDDVKKAVVMFVAVALGWLFTFGLGTAAVWVWSVVDAWRVATGKSKRWS